MKLGFGPQDRTSLASVRGIAPDWLRSARSYQVCPPKKLGRAAAATDLTDRSDRSDQTRRPAKVWGRERPAFDRLCVIGGLPEFPTGDGGRGVFGRAGRLIAVTGGTIGSNGAPAAPSPDQPWRFDFLRGLRGLRYYFMSQRVTSGFLSMICVYLWVFAVGPGIRDGAGDVTKRKHQAIG